MNYKEAKEVLEHHNNWRKGAEIEQLDPIVITQAMFVAINLLDSFNEPISKCNPPLRDTNTYLENGEKT